MAGTNATDKYVPRGLFVVCMLYLAIMGILSIDFGHHWDEPKLIRSLEDTIPNGIILPRWYNYPSLCYDIGILTASPHAIRLLATPVRKCPDGKGVMLVREIASPAFKLRLRSVFLILTLLTAVPVFLLARRLTRNDWIGLFSALCVVASWELFYHARWIAPDGLVMLFAAWSLLAQHRLLDTDAPPRSRVLSLCLAGIFAGLCTGTKYPGGIVLLPLACALLLSHEGHAGSKRSLLKEGTITLSICMATFLVTTPGALLEPLRFAQDINFELRHYAFSHGGYTIGYGLPHLIAMTRYLALILLSKNTVAALAAFCCAMAGGVYLSHTQKKHAVWLLSLPLGYIAYMTSKNVMFVRNLLILLPPLAVLAGIGVHAGMNRMKSHRLARALSYLLVSLFLLYNIVAITQSSLTIRRPPSISMKDAVAKHLAKSSATFLLSPEIAKTLGEPGKAYASKLAPDRNRADRFIFFSDEVPARKCFVANTPGRYTTIWSQGDELNWDYYPSWEGHRRVLEIRTDDEALHSLIDGIAR